MEPAIIAAIISGGVAIVSPITTYLATRAYDRRVLGKIEGRRKALVGTWRGNVAQEHDNEFGRMDIEITFTASGKLIEGAGEFHFPLNGELTRAKLKFTGGFYHGQFVKLDYTNPDESVVQFGCSILKLSADGRTLEGRYVGYGSIRETIVLGNVTLRRTA